ncbi:MAG TPA: hypothetical protein VHA80_05585 [Solirubrobacterales bacterium]|nr:hypothetical protein [Solirubrobacterales bacterium]
MNHPTGAGGAACREGEAADMSSYMLTVEPRGPGEAPGDARCLRFGMIERLLASLGQTLSDTIRATERPRMLEVRLETASSPNTSKQLYEDLADLDGERVRLHLRDGARRVGVSEVSVAALPREMRLDAEEVPWTEVSLVETYEEGDPAPYRGGPGTRPWTISGLIVLSGGERPRPREATAGPGRSIRSSRRSPWRRRPPATSRSWR